MLDARVLVVLKLLLFVWMLLIVTLRLIWMGFLLFVLVLNDCSLFAVIVLCRLMAFFDLCIVHLCRCLIICFGAVFLFGYD